MSETPETDAFFWRKDIDWNKEVEFCCKLERERDKYQEQADALLIRLGATQERMINAERKLDILRKHTSIMDISHKTANDEYLKLAVENENLERERDEWKEVAEGSLLGAIKERDALRNELNFTIRLSRTWEDDVKNISADRDYWKAEAERWRATR